MKIDSIDSKQNTKRPEMDIVDLSGIDRAVSFLILDIYYYLFCN